MNTKTLIDGTVCAPVEIVDVHSVQVGRLSPVTLAHCLDTELVRTVTRWRDENRNSFYSQRSPTFGSTASWMRSQLVERNDRLMFLIEDADGHCIGHCGLTNLDKGTFAAELDGILQGVRTKPRNLVYLAEKTLIGWCFHTLGLQQLTVQILGFNRSSIQLFSRLGFQLSGKIGLRKVEDDGFITYVPDPAANDETALELTLRSSDWNDGSKDRTAG